VGTPYNLTLTEDMYFLNGDLTANLGLGVFSIQGSGTVIDPIHNTATTAKSFEFEAGNGLVWESPSSSHQFIGKMDSEVHHFWCEINALPTGTDEGAIVFIGNTDSGIYNGSFTDDETVRYLTVLSDGRLRFTHLFWDGAGSIDTVHTLTSTLTVNIDEPMIISYGFDLDSIDSRFLLAVNGINFIDDNLDVSASSTALKRYGRLLAFGSDIAFVSFGGAYNGSRNGVAIPIKIGQMFFSGNSDGQRRALHYPPTDVSGLYDSDSGGTEDFTAHFTHGLYCTGNISNRYDPRIQSLLPIEDFGNAKYTYHNWESVNGVPGDDVLVIGGGGKLLFYSLASNLLTFAPLGSYNLTGTAAAYVNSRVSMASGGGRLFVSGDLIEPEIVNLDISSAVTSSFMLKLQIRDLEGVLELDANGDVIPDDFRPPTLTNEHLYNLRNQGWLTTTVPAYDDRKRTKIRAKFPIYLFEAYREGFPANTDPYPYYLDGSNIFDVRNAGHPGSSISPKGKFILDLFDQDRGAVSSLTLPTSSFDTTRTIQRPSTITFYAGRVWYSGVKDVLWTGRVYFSQTIRNDTNALRCYQANDPGSPVASDLLATDGGVIPIPDAGGIRFMTPLGSSLMVFGDKGVWSIKGGDGAFSAANFSVTKVHSAQLVAPETVVTAGERVLFWSNEGIFSVQLDSTGFSFQIDNISDATIKSLYNSISKSSKENCIGEYLRTDQEVYWLYSGDEQFDVRSSLTKALILNTVSGSFRTETYTELEEYSPIIMGILEKVTQNTETSTAPICDGEDTIVDGTDSVIATIVTPLSTETSKKFITAIEDTEDYKLAFSGLTNSDFLDWVSIDDIGANYSSYFETGFDNFGTLTRKKTAPQLWTFLTRTEDGFEEVEDLGSGAQTLQLTSPSSCFVTYKWDWTDTNSAYRWSSPRQVYRLKQFVPTDDTDPFDYSYTVVETRNKIRGHGKTLSLRFESEQSKDMRVEGWALEISAGSKKA
jgi:hypothetical protein